MTGRGKRKAPDAVDVNVARRVRARRLAMGLSQTQLADYSGITFQQVQKYETGSNRISASRLLEFSNALEVPVSYFFDTDPKSDVPDSVVQFSRTSDGMVLANSFTRIKSKPLRRSIVRLVEQIVGAGGDEV